MNNIEPNPELLLLAFHGDVEAARQLTEWTIGALQSGAPMPMEVRGWLAAVLRKLLYSIDAESERTALAFLGQRRRGRGKPKRPKLSAQAFSLAQAVSYLSRVTGKSEAVTAVAMAESISESTIYTACANTAREFERLNLPAPVKSLELFNGRSVLINVLKAAHKAPLVYSNEMREYLEVTFRP